MQLENMVLILFCWTTEKVKMCRLNSKIFKKYCWEKNKVEVCHWLWSHFLFKKVRVDSKHKESCVLIVNIDNLSANAPLGLKTSANRYEQLVESVKVSAVL